MNLQCNVTAIPEALFKIINGKREVSIYVNGPTKGRLEKISIMRDMYRLYIKTDNPVSSGEYRYTSDQASEIVLSFI